MRARSLPYGGDDELLGREHDLEPDGASAMHLRTISVGPFAYEVAKRPPPSASDDSGAVVESYDRSRLSGKEHAMGKFKVSISMSLDGYVAGPDQSEKNPLGIGGEQLHEWVVPLRAFRESHGKQGGEVNASTPIAEEILGNVGAVIMGRNMFGGGPGRWGDDPWKGWWGDNPPFHNSVFVLTHHAREPLEMQGGTTFYFVTDGIESALE
jgi:dihydrofolate reductase